MHKLKSSFSPILAVFVISAMLCLSPSAKATYLSWTISGPGTIGSTQSGTDATLTYDLDPAGFSTETWTATAVAPASGDYTVNWDYSGFHAFFEVTAFLNTFLNGTPVTNLVSAGPQDCCTPPSGGFDYTGSYTFIGINAGDSLGFTFGGSNFDSNNVLRGTLNLQQVLEPASLALLGIGLAGMVFSKRRKLT